MKYALLNIWLIISYIIVLFCVLVGVDSVLGLETLQGFIFMIVCGVHATACSMCMAISIAENYMVIK